MDVNNIVKEKTKNLMFGLAGGAAILIVLLLLLGVPLGPLSVGDRADLRLIFQPYIESSGVKDLCLASDATWHEDADFVGCNGLGPTSCSLNVIITAQTQCLAAGGEWYCVTGPQGGVYCKY